MIVFTALFWFFLWPLILVGWAVEKLVLWAFRGV